MAARGTRSVYLFSTILLPTLLLGAEGLYSYNSIYLVLQKCVPELTHLHMCKFLTVAEFSY